MLKHNDALFMYIHSIGSLFKRYDSNSECNDTNPNSPIKKLNTPRTPFESRYCMKVSEAINFYWRMRTSFIK